VSIADESPQWVRGGLTFAEFVNFGRVENIVSIFTRSEVTDGTRVAIGMFSSRDNLADVIASAPTSENGWSSSAAKEIFAFVSGFGGRVPDRSDRSEIAREAINLLAHQSGGMAEREKRGFTYGHLGESGEWLLEAYLDVEFLEGPVTVEGDTFDRVVLGAPLWIRTSRPEELVLYGGQPAGSKPPWPRRLFRRTLPGNGELLRD
jgi:hypothetical protein